LNTEDDLERFLKAFSLPFNNIASWHATNYGDGSPIEDSVIEEIRAAYQQESTTLTWRQGDLLVLDNMLVAHSHTDSQNIRIAFTQEY